MEGGILGLGIRVLAARTRDVVGRKYSSRVLEPER